MGTSWIMDNIRTFFAALDGFVYFGVELVYDLIVKLAHFRVFSDETLMSFATRIYAILGIFMLFKISFSFINYLINPDSFTDKEKGAQNIIKNVVIMFVMLVASPWCFTQLWNLQVDILDEKIIENFVFGDFSQNGEIKYVNNDACEPIQLQDTGNAGNLISVLTFRPFYQPYSNDETPDSLIEALCIASQYSVSTMVLPKQIRNRENSHGFINSFFNTMSKFPFSFIVPPSVRVVEDYFDEPTYYMDYKFGISTAMGVFVLLILLNFALETGTRMVKLSFLQLIAPIPIVSYVDPASGKNGMFKKWLKEVGSTWASLFIRLFALFFAVSVIQQVGSLIPITKDEQSNMWVTLFVIIGALMFAKQLPKLIQDITGIKLDGGLTLNPFKKIRDQALGGNVATAAMTGVAAGTLGFAGGMAANAWAMNRKNDKIKKDLAQQGIDKNNPLFKQEFRKAGGKGLDGYAASMTAGGFSSAARAISKGKDGTWHPIKNASAGVEASSTAREARADGWGIKDRIHDKMTDIAHIKSTTGTTSERKNEINQKQMELENIKRDEQRFSYNMSVIESADNGRKAALYADAFRFKPVQDSDGNWTYQKQSPDNYNDFVASRSNGAIDLEKLRNQFMADQRLNNPMWGTLSMEKQEEQIQKHLDTAVDNYINTEITTGKVALTREDYNIYDNLVNLRNQADLDGKKMQKEITKAQEQLDKMKNKK